MTVSPNLKFPISEGGFCHDRFNSLGTSRSRLQHPARPCEPTVPAVVPAGIEGSGDESLATTGFAPAVDVYEDEHNTTLKIEVPGIDEKDIDVRIENNTLTVHGERKFEKEEKEENYRRIERQYGSFTRSFTLPTTVDSEKVSASYDKGVLKITLPKKAEAKPKQIKVNIGGVIKNARPWQPKARPGRIMLCGTGSQTRSSSAARLAYGERTLLSAKAGGGKLTVSRFVLLRFSFVILSGAKNPCIFAAGTLHRFFAPLRMTS